jgi:hypothetical protein
MQCSRSEFLTAIETWRGSPCAVHLHTDEISGAVVVTFHSASANGVLEFSAHPLLQPLTVDLSNANEFEFGVPEREAEGADSELVKQVADEIVLARVAGKLVFSMTRLVDPSAGSFRFAVAASALAGPLSVSQNRTRLFWAHHLLVLRGNRSCALGIRRYVSRAVKARMRRPTVRKSDV